MIASVVEPALSLGIPMLLLSKPPHCYLLDFSSYHLTYHLRILLSTLLLLPSKYECYYCECYCHRQSLYLSVHSHMAKAFSLVNDSGRRGNSSLNNCSDDRPLPISSNKDFNVPLHSSLNLHSEKMARKRAASDIEIQPVQRFLRRTASPTTTTDIIPLDEFGVCSINIVDTNTGVINNPNQHQLPDDVPTYSTTIVLPSCTDLSVTSSSTGGTGSESAFSTSSSSNMMDSLSPAPLDFVCSSSEYRQKWETKVYIRLEIVSSESCTMDDNSVQQPYLKSAVF